MSPRLARRVQRAVHLLAAAVLAVYVYGPWATEPAFQTGVRFVTLPVLIVTGLGLWLLPRWTARRRRASARGAS